MTRSDEEKLNIINDLTDDHELQSELWISLSENPEIPPIEALNSIALKLKNEEILYSHFRTNIIGSPKEHTFKFLDSLEQRERTIITLCMLGFEGTYICQYKSISYIRYRQLISSLVISNNWKQYLEEETKLRGKTRTK